MTEMVLKETVPEIFKVTFWLLPVHERELSLILTVPLSAVIPLVKVFPPFVVLIFVIDFPAGTLNTMV